MHGKGPTQPDRRLLVSPDAGQNIPTDERQCLPACLAEMLLGSGESEA